MESNALLKDIFTIPEVVAASDFVLRLHEGVDHAAQTASEYVATTSLADAFDRALGLVDNSVTSGKPHGVFLHGTFGSGKSHFMAVLDLILRGEPSARAIDGLAEVVAKREHLLGRNMLTVEYHLIGATSLEEALFSGFTKRIAGLHPEATPPPLHRSDALFQDAADRRTANESDFFTRLNEGNVGGGGWGAFATGWDADTYDRAAAAPPGDSDRARLAADLVRTMFRGQARAGQWLEISDGLAVMAHTAKDLGYDGLVLFLDELVLWLATHAANPAFVSSEASKVAKLVESGVGDRAVPLVSFVARQRELSDFLGDDAAGVIRAGVGQAIQYWEDRFDTITLSASNLPDVAHRRLLLPRSAAAAGQIAQAVAAVKASPSWDILLEDEAASGEEAFAKVYPFSPALVDVLVALSGRLQRERTALKVMAQLLTARRDTGHINEVIGVGDLYEVMVGSGEQPLTEEMRHLFGIARNLYDTKFLPTLLDHHRLSTADEAAAGHQFHKDAKLAKTMLVAALVPEVRSVSRLTAGRLAALNHGTVQAWIPGEEATAVLATVRGWAQQIGEIHIGDTANPILSVELSGVDYDSVLDRVQNEDTPGRRRQLLRRLLFEELRISEPSQMALDGQGHDHVWRGTKRTVEVLFGNIRDSVNMPDSSLIASGERWKLVIDYPFDEGNHGPQEDVNRFDQLRVAGQRSRTVGWVPYFLTSARQNDLGKLVLLEHLLGGTGAQFDANALQLPVDQRALARQGLSNVRRALTETIKTTLRKAYGIQAAAEGDPDIDRSGFGEFSQLPTLWQDQPLPRPASGTLDGALGEIIDRMLELQYPGHPRLEPSATEVRPADLRAMWDVIQRASQSPNGRLDPVEQNRRPVMRRLATPLRLGYVGETHFVFDQANFGWHPELVQAAARDGLTDEIPVASIRGWLAERGMTREMGNLIIASFALIEDKQFQLHGGVVPITDPTQIRDEMVLVNPRLPGPAEWAIAGHRAADLFGINAGRRLTASNVTMLGRQLDGRVQEFREPARNLVAQLTGHAEVLGLDGSTPRLATARAGVALLEALATAPDDVTRVEALAAVGVPDQPQALGRSVSSAAAVAAALQRQDWTTLEAVAREAANGTPGAETTLQDVRRAAVREQLHEDLLKALARSHAAATQWLVRRQPALDPDVPPNKSDPDQVRLVEFEGSQLAVRLDELSTAIQAQLRERPGGKVTIRWSVK